MATIIETQIPVVVDEQMLASAIVTQGRPKRPGALSASITLAWRAWLKLKHVPTQLFDVTMFPIMMTLMFTFIFGGALAGSTESYVQELIPGIFVLTITMISQYTALGLNRDIKNGIFDRFRSLSFWRPAVLIGALLGDTIRYMSAVFVLTVLGFVLGFRPETGLSGILLSLGIVLAFGFSLSWIWTTLGLLIDDAESVMMISSVAAFPITFISNVFVDPATMPELLQKFAHINPASLTVTVVRGLMHGNLTSTDLVNAFVAYAILVVIFAPLTMVLYNKKGKV